MKNNMVFFFLKKVYSNENELAWDIDMEFIKRPLYLLAIAVGIGQNFTYSTLFHYVSYSH
jgi:hypothetical protein